MSPWNTDIFTYGKERPRGRKWVAQSIAAGDRFVVSSLGNTEETVRLGADPDAIDRIVWYVDLRPFGPEQRDHAALAARFGWPDDSLIVLSLRNYRENTNLDVVLRAFKRAHDEEPRARLILAAREGVMTETVRGWVNDLGAGRRRADALHPAARAARSSARRPTWPCRWRRPTPRLPRCSSAWPRGSR